MIAHPVSNISVRDGGLAVAPSGAGLLCIIGPSSGGVAGNFYSYGGTDVDAVTTEIGQGGGVDSVITSLINAGVAVLYYKPTTTTAGSNSAVVNTGGGPTVTLTGIPTDDGELILEVVLAGAIGTSQVRYSLDGGDTYSEVLVTASTILMPNGVTLNLAAGTYLLGATYTATHTGPSMTSTNVGDACNAVIASPFAPKMVWIVGQAADAAGAATIAALLSTKVTAAHAVHKYPQFVMEAPAVAKAGLITAFASISEKNLTVCAGFAEIINARSDEIQKRSSARVLVPRFMRNPSDIHALRDEADSNIDSLSEVRELVPNGAVDASGYYDDFASGALLNNARFSTLTSIPAAEGYFPTNGLTMAPAGSDFQQLQFALIMNDACAAWYLYSLRQMAMKLRVSRAGKIDPTFADSIEFAGQQYLKAALGSEVREVVISVNRNDDLSTDSTLRTRIKLQGDQYALEQDTEIGFVASLLEAA